MYTKEEKAKLVTREIAKGTDKEMPMKKKMKKKKKKSLFDDLQMPAAPGNWDRDMGDK